MVYSLETILLGFPDGLTFKQLKAISRDAGYHITQSELHKHIKISTHIIKIGKLYKISKEYDQLNINLQVAMKDLMKSLTQFALATKAIMPIPEIIKTADNNSEDDLNDDDSDSDSYVNRKFWLKNTTFSPSVPDHDTQVKASKH